MAAVIFPQGGPGCSLARSSCSSRLWSQMCMSGFQLPTGWAWDTGQTASIVGVCLCQSGKCTLLGRAVMGIKCSHAWNKQFFQPGKIWREVWKFWRVWRGKSVTADAESRPCFRTGYHSHGWERRCVLWFEWVLPKYPYANAIWRWEFGRDK